MGRLRDSTLCRRAFMLVFILLFFPGCTGYIVKPDRPKGVYHRIKKGETLWSIARAYHVNAQDIAEINNIDNPSLIETNEVLFIPEAKQVIDDVMSSIIRQKAPQSPGKAGTVARIKETEAKSSGREPAIKKGEGTLPQGIEAGAPLHAPVDKRKMENTVEKAVGYVADEEEEDASPASNITEGGKSSTKTAAKQGIPAKQADEVRFDRKRFIWPVKGNIASRFGIQPNGMFYNGIRISVKEGQQVVASDGGTVIFSSLIKDYGETIIVKHEDNYATVYTHLGSRLAKTDDRVKKGEQIALLSKGDMKAGTFMDFEIRHNNKARNPLFFLP